MSDAPEKIWATTGLYYEYVQDWSEGEWQDDAESAIGTGDDETVVEYTRSDLAQAMVAATYEDAATYWQKRGDAGKGAPYMAPSIIRKRTPTDARAALDAMLAKAREDALDSVLKEVEGYLPEFGAGEPQDGTDRIIDQCWRDFRKVVTDMIAKDT